jgi:hypothetical protein
MTDKKYNGWTNYPTWRINLEIFDGYDHEVKDVDAEWCEEYAEEIIFGAVSQCDEESLMSSYATSFISDVNWHEIAESINEIQKQDVWEA